MQGWKEHVQAHIAKSLISSIVSKHVEFDPDIDMSTVIALVLDSINDNAKYGYCDIFKENR